MPEPSIAGIDAHHVEPDAHASAGHQLSNVSAVALDSEATPVKACRTCSAPTLRGASVTRSGAQRLGSAGGGPVIPLIALIVAAVAVSGGGAGSWRV